MSLNRIVRHRRIAGVSNLFRASRRLGVGWLVYRLWKEGKDRLGITAKQMPIRLVDSISMTEIASCREWQSTEAFFQDRSNRGVRFVIEGVPSTDHFSSYDQEEVLQELHKQFAELQAGRIRYFSGDRFPIGTPPDWFYNPIHDRRAPAELHFCRINDFAYGDIKVIWEASRFSWVFELIRYFARTRDERAGQLFFDWTEDWIDRNPPNQGVHWKCGQECAMRAIALLFGMWTLGRSCGMSTSLLNRLIKLFHQTALRIERYIDYALQQNNNHSISEASGLLAIGTLFPELHEAQRWRRMGKELLERQVRKLFFDDGGFVQYSANYHRLALHLLTFSQSLLRHNQDSLADDVVRRIVRATEFMECWTDDHSGGAPRFGNDDGSLMFPLSHCDYDDFRPSLQSAFGLFVGTRRYADGPWDEECLWLGVKLPEQADIRSRTKLATFEEGGISVIRNDQSFAVLRCGRQRFRPAQLDIMHVDLWYRGRNEAIDPGTFSYNAPPPYADGPFAAAKWHNTVLLNLKEPADRLSKFLFDPWPEGRVHAIDSEADDRPRMLHGSRVDHFVARFPTKHDRFLVPLPENHWFIADCIDNREALPHAVHWPLASAWRTHERSRNLVVLQSSDEGSVTLVCNVPFANVSLERAVPNSPRGWYAPRYQSLNAATSIAAETLPAAKCWIFTIFTPVTTPYCPPKLSGEFRDQFCVQIADFEVTIRIDDVEQLEVKVILPSCKVSS